MKTVIVTGGIGSGKSAVCDLLRARGIPVYDSDRRVKELYDTVPGLVSRLESALGMVLRDAHGLLDRAALAARIFSDDAARQTLEAVVYPLVLEDFLAWRDRQAGVPFVVLESAVILSKPVFDGLADAVVVVTAPEPVRVARVMARDGLSAAAVRARLAAQQEPAALLDAARGSGPACPVHVLENAGTLEDLSAALDRLWPLLLH